MRRGQSPFKADKHVAPPARISVCSLVCIPHLDGYFSGTFESLKLCLASVVDTPQRQSFDLTVMDNGSCKVVTSFLEQQLRIGAIDYLIRSHRNIGKPNAQRQMLRFCAGDIVFYLDSDVYCRPGWMEAELEVLRAFPNVGIVGGQPVRDLADFYTANTLAWAKSGAGGVLYEVGRFLPPAWDADYSRSFGRDSAWAAQRFAERDDHRVTLGGVSAYFGVAHQQFAMPRFAIERIPFERFASAICDGDDQLNEAIDAAGLLQLSIAEPLVYHIGNDIVEPWLKEEYRRLVGD